MSPRECDDYATAKGHKFIGSGYEPKEYPGCTFWVSGHVEFNEATDEKGGCNLGAKNGQCVCAVTRKSK